MSESIFDSKEITGGLLVGSFDCKHAVSVNKLSESDKKSGQRMRSFCKVC